MLTHARDVGAAKRLLKKETDRCSSPVNRRALSTLYTTLAWTLRAGTDPDAVLKAGSEAFVLARDEDARHEMGRALTVMGATLHDLKDLEQAESLLVHAIDLVPRGEYQDRWRALERLGEVLAAQGQGADARTAFRSAIEAAEAGSFGWCAAMSRDRMAKVR